MIALGCDHGGYNLKLHIIDYLKYNPLNDKIKEVILLLGALEVPYC